MLITVQLSSGARRWVAALVLLLGACSSGGGGGGDGDTTLPGPGAFNFNSDNMLTAAGIAAAATVPFAPLSEVSAGFFSFIESTAPESGKAYDLAACSGGSATLTYVDGNGDGKFSAGDRATVVAVNCRFDPASGEVWNGSIDYAFTEVVLAGPPKRIVANVTLDLSGTGAGGTEGYAGELPMTAVAPSGVNYSSFAYRDPSDPDKHAGLLTYRKNGEIRFQFGCLNVDLQFLPESGVSYRLRPRGVVRVQDKIFSILASGPNGPLDFVADDYPDRGGMSLLSLSVPECAALGVPQGVGDSDGSALEMVALAGGADDLRVERYDKDRVLQQSVTTTWGALLEAPSSAPIITATNAIDVASTAVASLNLPRDVATVLLDLALGAADGTPDPLCTSGSYSVSFDSLPLAAGHVATLAFNDCAISSDGGSMTVNGSATLTVEVLSGDPGAAGTIGVAISPLGLTSVSASETSVLSGGLRFVRTASSAGFSETASSLPGVAFSIAETAGGATHTRSLSDFSISSTLAPSGAFTLGAPGEPMSISSSRYSGPLALNVTQTFAGPVLGDTPSAGALAVTAQDASGLKLAVGAGGAVTLEVDSNGDGVVDATIPTTWGVID